MKSFLLIIILFISGCADNKEWSTQKIKHLDDKRKLSDAIQAITSMEELNTLMSLLSDEQKDTYLDYTAQKEQDLRFPRPTPMTLEYLDSITNRSIYNLALEYTNEVNTTLTNKIINDRLILIETINVQYTFDGNDSFVTLMKLSEFNLAERCQNYYKSIFYNAVYHDPIDNKYYFGKTIYTNNIDYILPSTNNITLGTPESIIYITNISPSERLYLDLNNLTLFVREISRIIESEFGKIYFTGDPYNPDYSIINENRNNLYRIRLLIEGGIPILLTPERSSWLEGSWILWCLSQNHDDDK